MTEDKWPRFTMSLPPELKKKIRKEARNQGLNLAEFIRQTMERRLTCE